MRKRFRLSLRHLAIAAWILLGASPAMAAQPIASLVVSNAAASVLSARVGRQLQTNQLAITLIDLRDTNAPRQGSFRGKAPTYPASVVKLFYLAAAHQWMADGKLSDSPELRRAMREMIVESSNDATSYVLDVLTGTTSGPEMDPSAMEEWSRKRNTVNRHFSALGFTGLNINQKPWGDGPFGRERIFVGKNYENRNQLTTDATARLLMEIALGRHIDSDHCRQMLSLLHRNPADKSDSQASEYIGAVIPPGSKLWSKAGWTGTVRHDAALVELPGGHRLILVIFTSGHSEDQALIQDIARHIFSSMGQ